MRMMWKQRCHLHLPSAICHQSINPFKGLKSDTGMVVFTVVVVTIGSLQPTSTQLYCTRSHEHKVPSRSSYSNFKMKKLLWSIQYTDSTKVQCSHQSIRPTQHNRRSALCTLHSALYSLYSPLSTLHSTLCTFVYQRNRTERWWSSSDAASLILLIKNYSTKTTINRNPTNRNLFNNETYPNIKKWRRDDESIDWARQAWHQTG